MAENYTILVCDDEKEITDAIEIYLTQEGYRVLKAYNGNEAIDLLNKEHVHLLIIDLMMPGMDGMTAVLKIRKTMQSSIPIIILSAKSQDTEKIMGLNYGADDYITKPFSPLELVARVNSQLRRYTTLGTITEPEEHSNVYRSGGLVIDDDKTVEHAVLIDTAKALSSANIIKKLKALGVKKLDAIIISHAHGDHYGGVTNIMKAFPTAEIYVPDPTGLDKYQKAYGSALRSQYKKAKGHYMSKGTAWTIGSMQFECIYICPAASLKEHDSHHFVNNQSAVLRINLNGWIYHTAGDLQNEGNNLLVKAIKNLKAHIYKCQWHGDANACNETICKAIRPLIAFSNYHHKEGSGRGTTRKRLQAVGAVVARNWENGDIYIDCLPDVMKLSCSKGNLSKTWRR